jgi:hypothetical protein
MIDFRRERDDPHRRAFRIIFSRQWVAPMVFSNRHAARHHEGANHELLRQRAARFAREHLIGLTVINQATQLAITLTADALGTTASRRIPPDLLRLFPRLPEMLSNALYLNTSADLQRCSSIRRIVVLVARGAAARRDVFFTIRENHQSQCFLDRLDVEDQTAHFRSAGGEASNAMPNSTGNVPRRYIFVGGLDDETRRPVAGYVDNFRRAHPDADVHYFSWTDTDGILNAIRSTPPGTERYVIGHSWGANSAGFAIGYMAPTGIHVENMLSIDPVARNVEVPPDGFRGAVDKWINVTATPSGPPDRSDAIAAIGGRGGRFPLDRADVNYNVDAHHAEFTRMMTAPAPGLGGLSPEQFVLGSGASALPPASPPNDVPAGNSPNAPSDLP